MRRTTTLALTAALAMSGLAMSNDTYVPVIETERVYAHCGDTLKVSNVEGGTPFASDTTPPAASFTAGAGCGTADLVMTGNPDETAESFELTASHTGNLDALTVELHMIDAGVVRLYQSTGELPEPGEPVPNLNFDRIYFDTELFIDGVAAGWVGEAKVFAERSSTGASVRLRFTITDIDLLGEDEAGQHDLTLKVTTGEYQNGDSGAWVLDATEVPTGIIFNPAPEDIAEASYSSF